MVWILSYVTLLRAKGKVFRENVSAFFFSFHPSFTVPSRVFFCPTIEISGVHQPRPRQSALLMIIIDLYSAI